ncbi:MAG: HAD family phosphatase [Candidatus Aenigmarchaeota archaeon]|nr:HAD family phosphatase [Candidatus Aenigmarchaeota archaeon]
MKKTNFTKAAFFDIDGTLIRSQIVMEFPKYLMEQKIFSKTAYLNILKVITKYGMGFLTYRNAGIQILEIYADALKDKDEKEILLHSKKFAEEHIKKAYSYSELLVDYLRENYILVAISASPIDPVKEITNYFHFDKVFATEREIKNNIATGKIKTDMLDKCAKKNTLLDFSKKNNIDLKKSFAFGDSSSDAEFLSVVGHPIALNPNRKLRKIALKNNWNMFTKNENIVEKIKIIEKENTADA